MHRSASYSLAILVGMFLVLPACSFKKDVPVVIKGAASTQHSIAETAFPQDLDFLMDVNFNSVEDLSPLRAFAKTLVGDALLDTSQQAFLDGFYGELRGSLAEEDFTAMKKVLGTHNRFFFAVNLPALDNLPVQGPERDMYFEKNIRLYLALIVQDSLALDHLFTAGVTQGELLKETYKGEVFYKVVPKKTDGVASVSDSATYLTQRGDLLLFFFGTPSMRDEYLSVRDTKASLAYASSYKSLRASNKEIFSPSVCISH